MWFDRISFWLVLDRTITQPYLSGGKQEVMSLVIYGVGISYVRLQTAHYRVRCYRAGQTDGQKDRSISLLELHLPCLHQPFSAICHAGLISDLFNMRCAANWDFTWSITALPQGRDEEAVSSSHLSSVCLQGGFRADIGKMAGGLRYGEDVCLTFIKAQWRADVGCCALTVSHIDVFHSSWLMVRCAQRGVRILTQTVLVDVKTDHSSIRWHADVWGSVFFQTLIGISATCLTLQEPWLHVGVGLQTRRSCNKDARSTLVRTNRSLSRESNTTPA